MSETKQPQEVDYSKENILRTDFYMHLCIVNSINAMSNALFKEGKILDAYSVIRVNCYILEKLAWAGGILNDDDSNYLAYLNEEKRKLLADGLKEDDPIFKPLLALAKIAYVQRILEKSTPLYQEVEL